MNKISLNELSYDLLMLTSGGQLPDDYEIPKKQMIYWIKNQYAVWLKRDVSKTNSIAQSLITDLGCIDLETIDRAECCDIEIECSIKRTAVEMPRFIRMKQGLAITRVGSIDKIKRPFNIIPYERAPYIGNQLFGNNATFAYWKNERLYILSKHPSRIATLKKINVQGVLEDFTDAKDFVTCSGDLCYTHDRPVPISRDLVDYMKKAILDLNLSYFLKIPEDNTNDGSSQNVAEEAQEIQT